MTARAFAALAGLVLLAGCVRHRPPVAPGAGYVVGPGYRLDDTWFYPREDFHYDATGIASIETSRSGTTADGEARDPAAMTAAHQTLQLPVVARVTNLATGRQVEVRIDDRGPASPARLIALSPRAAALLGMDADGTAPVRVEVEEGPSLALREQLNGGPHLDLAAAPLGEVTSQALAPPPGTGQSSRGRSAGAARTQDRSAEVRAAAVPDRLPEVVRQVPAQPGALVIHAGSFGQMTYARQVAARLAGIGAEVERVREGRTERYDVRAGPFAGVAAADAALDRAMRAGVSDARIVVE